MKDQKPAVANKGWVGQLGENQFSLGEAVGGWRGVAESLLPGLVFIVAYVFTHELFWPLLLSAGLTLVFTIVRLVQKQPLTQAFAGAIGVGIGVLWAGASGKAENYFAWGLVTNGFFFSIFLGSLLLRRPAVGLIINWVQGLETALSETDEETRDPAASPTGPTAGPTAPRTGQEHDAEDSLKGETEAHVPRVNHALHPASQVVWATWVWVAVFGIRLALQLPLYLTGNVVWLGVVKLAGGLPLFALGGWFTWILLRSMFQQAPKTDETRQVR